MKKPCKILLFLSVGLGVFLLLWHLGGQPAFTPLMAMERTERGYLLENTRLLACCPTYYYGPDPRYDIITADDAYLYYGQARGRSYLYWGSLGVWQLHSFHRTPRGETVSYVRGSEATIYYHDPAEDLRRDCIGLPFYIFTDGIEYDEIQGLLEVECTDLSDDLPGKHTLQFTATAEPVDSGHVLWFGQHQMTVRDQPDLDLDTARLDHIWFYADLGLNPSALTLTFYHRGHEVHTQQLEVTP